MYWYVCINSYISVVCSIQQYYMPFALSLIIYYTISNILVLHMYYSNDMSQTYIYIDFIVEIDMFHIHSYKKEISSSNFLITLPPT